MELSMNTSEPMLWQAADVPMTNFQLLGSNLPVPVASMATAPAAAADNGGGNGSSSASSQNASGPVQGQGDNMSLSLQLWQLGSTPATVSVPPMAPVTSPALTPAPLANASLAAVANALALRRKNLAAQRSTALLTHLRRCAEALVVSRSQEDADVELASIARLASTDGDAVQRMAVAFAEALARVAIRPWKGVTATLFPSDGGDVPRAWEAAAAHMNFLNLCPLLHLATVAVNEIILETTKNDKFIQVVDLGGVHYGQWVDLLHAFASRREVRPFLRLSVVHEDKKFLSQASLILVSESDRLGIPFDLHIVEVSIEALKLDTLGVRSDHAVIIVSTLQLHRLVGTSITTSSAGGGITSSLPATMSTRVDKLLLNFHLLSPRLVIVTENEASHFGPVFMERFVSALGYFEQLFRSVKEASLAYCQPAERKAVERYRLKEEIKDIIACEHGPRWARHERLGRWIIQIGAAGFVFSLATSSTAAGPVRSVAAGLLGGDKI